MQKEQFPVARNRFIKRTVLVLLSVVTAASLIGCITFLTQINVNGDGRGTMVQTITMNLNR